VPNYLCNAAGNDCPCGFGFSLWRICLAVLKS